MSGRAVLLMVWLATLAAVAFGISRHATFTTDLRAFLPAASTPDQALLLSQLRDGVGSRLVLVAIEGGDSARRADASRGIATSLAGDARFGIVANGDPTRFARELELLWRWRYLVSPAVDAGRFTTSALGGALDAQLRLLASPVGASISRSITRDPTGELQVLAGLAGGAGSPTSRDGVWTSPDGDRALLVVETRAPAFDIDAQQAAGAAIRAAFESQPHDGLRLTMSSPGLIAAQARAAVEGDARTASALTSAGVVALLLAVYRSIWPALLSALPAASGVIAGIAAVAIGFGEVQALTVGFGAMVVGEAVDYPTYLFANRGEDETLQATRIRIGHTLLLAVATTAAGALAMLLSGFRGLVELGVFVIVGVAVAGLVTAIALPSLTPTRALVHSIHRPSPFLARIVAGVRGRWTITCALGLVAVVVLALVPRPWWDDDLASLTPVPEAAKRQDRDLRAQAGAPDPRHLVVVRGRDRQQALEASERLERSLARAVSERVISGYDLAARYEPSEATQRARREALPDAATLRASLAEALSGRPFRPDAFEPFVADVAQARDGPLLTRASLDGTALALKVDSLLTSSADGVVALVPLVGVTQPARLRDIVAADGNPSASVLDIKAETEALVSEYRQRVIFATLAGLGAIALVLAVATRSLRHGVRLLVPVLVAVLATFAALLALGHRPGTFHVVALLLVVGVGTNYALFFDRPSDAEHERDRVLLSVLVAAGATLIAALSMAVSTTPVLSAIGTTMALGVAFSLLTCSAMTARRA